MGLQHDVRLARIASLNIDNTSEDEMAFLGARSVTQFDSGAPYGGNRDAVSLSANTANYPAHFTSTNTFYGEVVRDLCGGGNIGYANGHTFSGMSYQFGNLAAGASRKVKFAYRAF